MAQSVLLPDGSSVTIRAGETPQSAYARAQQMYPDAFAAKTPEEGPKSGFMPALKAGVSGIKSDTAALLGRTGLMELPAAEKYIAEQEAYKKKTFKPTQEGFTEAPIANIKELLGGSLPYMAAPLAAGAAAAALPLTGLAATAAGVGAAGLASAGQFTGSNLSRQMQEGKKLEETDLGAAALAAIPQAALDTLSLRMLPGVGKILQSAGISASEQVAANYAKEALKKTAADYFLKTGRTMGVEGLTEAGQQVFERMQAGLSITDANARKEYFDSFVGGAVLGGVIAPAGRYVERGAEQGRFDKQQREDQKTQADAARVEQEKLDATTLATKQTPEYAQKAQADYVAAEQRQKELEGQIHKASKGNKLTEDQKQDNRETQQALAEHATVLKDTNKEYRQYRQFLPKEPAPPLGQDTTQLQQRDMFGNLPTPKTPELDMQGKPVERAAPEAAPEDQGDLQLQIRGLSDYLNRLRDENSKIPATDTDAKIAIGEKYSSIKKMLTEVQKIVPPEVDVNAISTKITDLTKKIAKADTNGDVDISARYASQIKELQKQLEAAPSAPSPQQQFEMQPFQSTVTGDRQLAIRPQYAANLNLGVEEQEADIAAQQALAEEQYRGLGREQDRAFKVGLEAKGLQRIGERPVGGVSSMQQFDMFEQPYPDTGLSPALSETVSSLTGAPSLKQQRAATPAGETLPAVPEIKPEEPPTPQRGGPAPFKLRPSQENVKAPATATSLRERVNQLQLREDLSDEAYAFLRRADASIGENDLALGNEASLFTMMDEQLGKIERGEEGVYGEGAPAKRAEITPRGGEGTGAMAEALRESGAALPSTVTGLPGSVTTPTAAEKVKSGFAGKTYNLSDSERAKALAKVRKEKYEQLVGEGVPKNEAARRASLIKQEDVAQGVMTGAGPTAVSVRGRAEATPAMNADQALKAAIAANPKAAQQVNVQRAARQLENIGTMRGPSAKAKPLSLPRELETHLRVKEELAQSEKNIDQMPLFPEKEVPATALGRATPGMFRRFLDSKIVKEMREAEARTKVHKQQAPKVTYYFGLINELEAKLNALVTESDLRGTAKSILKDNDEVVALLQQYGKLKADPMFSSILAMTSVDNEKEIKALTQDVAVYTKTLAELDKQAAEAKQAVAKRKEQIDRLNKMLSGIAPLETKLEAATAQLGELQKKGAAPAPEKTQEYKNEIASLKRQIESKLGFGEIGYEAPAFVFGQEDTQTMAMFEAALKKIKDNRVLVDTLQRQNKKLRQEMSQFSKLRTTAENTQAMLADLSSTLNSVSKTQDNIDKIPAVMDAQKTLWDLERSGKDPEVLKKEIAQAQVDLRNAVVAKEEADAASKEAAKSPSTKAYEQAAAAVKKRRAGIEAQLATLRDQARAQRTKEENVRLYGAKQKTALPGGISVAPITSTTYAGKVQNQITNAAMDNIDAIEKEINELKQELEDKQKEGLPGKPQQMQITRLEAALQEANEFYNEQLKTEGIAKSNKEYAKQILAWPLKKLKLELGTLENQANALEDKVKAARAKSLSHFEKQKAKEAGLVTFASLPPGKYPEVSKVKVSQLIPSERNKTPGGARPSPVFAFKGQGAAFRQTEILRLKRDSVAQRIEQVEALDRQGKTAEETETQAPQRKASERGNVAPSSVTRTGPVTRGVTSNVAKLTESKRSGRPISSRQQQLERLQANIDAAQIKANEAAANLKKTAEAYEATKGQPAQVREDAKAAYEAADSRLETSRGNLDAAKALLEAEDITKNQREKLGPVSESTQEFAAATGARPLLSRGPTKNPSTSASVKAELKEYFPDLGRVKIYDTVDALVKANPQYKTLIPSDARGFVDTAGNKAFLIAENIDQGQALGVLLHEIGAHVGLKSILGENQYNALVNVVGVWAKKNDGSLESRVAKSALARVKEAETEAKHQDDETLAYAIEEAVKAGIKPSQTKSVLGTWLGRIANAFRKLLTKFGMNPETLNAQGLVDMAFGAAQMEMQPAPTGMSRRMFLRGAVAAVGGMKLPAVKTGLSLEAKAELFNATLDAADAWFNTVVGMAKTPALRGMLKEYSFDIDYDVFAEALYNMDSDVEGVESLYSHLHWESYGNGDSTESLLALLRSKPDAIEKLQGAIFDVRSQLMSMIDKLPKKENGEIAENELPEVGELLFSRKADYKSDDALTRLAKKAVAQDKTYKERAGSHIGLQIEMAAADMRAGVIKALNNAVEDPKTMGSTKLFRQAIFSITAADQAMSTTQMSLSVGPPKMVKDAKGYYSVNSSMENDAGQVFDAVQDIPDSYGNAEAKMGLASIYMIAQRALNKGLKKLDLGALGIKTEQELIDAMAAANADPKLKAALENVRKKYNAYNRGMIEWLSSPQVAAISQADAKAYLKDEDYVPYYRVRADGTAELVFGGEKTLTIGDIRHQPYLAELKGGEAKIMPLDKSIMRNTMLLVTKGMNNMAMKNVGYAMQAAGDGLGPIGKNGKPTNLMPINVGKGPDQANVIRWTQEPDPNKPDDKGDRWLRVETNDTLFGGIPAELIIKSLDGAHLTLPAFLKWGGIAGDLLRSGITRTPIYLARQLFRDPFAATATSGLDYGPITAIFKANKEFLKIAAGKSETGAKMIEKGLLQSGLFEGDITNMSKIALQLASGKSQGVIDRVLAGADRLALQADAATRTLIYDNAIKNGLSEAEADYAVRESMNFSKRGLSPTVQYASRLIPFFNAQIQGLSVLVKAATGNMPSEDVLKIKRKFANNAMMLTGFGLAYAMAMDDDEYYKNAKPKDRYSNFFVPLPGVDEPLKLPIPYEFGFFFSAGVALADSIKGEVDTPQQLRAIKDMFVGAIPGASGNFVPQIVKPLAEVYANRNFFSGTPLESARLEKLNPEARYNAHTTEVAKWMATMVPGLSPIQIEHIVSGYLGQIPLMVLASTNEMFRDGKEEPTRKLSEMPLIGSSFQRKYGGEDADVVYKLANDAMEAKRTFENYRKTGKLEDAKEFLADNRAEIMVAPMAAQYQKLMGALRKQEEIIRGSNMPPDAKEKRIDALNEQRQLQSERYLKAIRRAEAASGRTTPQ